MSAEVSIILLVAEILSVPHILCNLIESELLLIFRQTLEKLVLTLSRRPGSIQVLSSDTHFRSGATT